MSTQLFICNHDAPMPELFVPVENDPEGYFRQKPKGGLWTSTWNEKGQDSDWVAWCRGEDFGDPDNKRWFLLTPKSTCRLYTIDSLKDFQQCLRDYGCPTPIAQKHPIFALKRTIDFERLALEYDGLHLTEQGNEETHLSHPNDLNGWDCESTLWFRWCFADVQAIPTPKSQPLCTVPMCCKAATHRFTFGEHVDIYWLDDPAYIRTLEHQAAMRQIQQYREGRA